MPDKEKVVKGLLCIKGDYIPCASCKYANADGYGRGDRCKRQCASDAIALLKEQEAVPVIQREVMHMLVWCCGSCGVAITDGDKFCRMCGKKVKWNE